MKYFIKRYWLLLIVQTACLALGIWAEQRFVDSSPPRDGQHNENASRTGDSIPADAASAAKLRLISLEPTSPAMPAFAIHAMAFLWIAGLQTIVAYLILMRDQEKVSRQHIQAEHVSLRQYNELLRTRDAVIFGLARLTESRDLETGNHLERISIYSMRLASAARRDPRFCTQITPSFVKLIGISSVLHDIGKVGVRDSILLKPGKLEPQERPQMQLHAAIGGKCIREIESRLGKSSFLTMAREIAFNHHEHWDGSGYPKGVADDEIPLAARIVAIADVYDALSTKRVYREAVPHEKCVQMIRRQAGRQFDPALVEIFLKLESEFRYIAQQDRVSACDSEDVRSAPVAETRIIAVDSEASIDEKFSMLQAAIDLCADNLPPAATSPQERFAPWRNRRPARAPSLYTPELILSTAEKEPENVA